MNTNGVQLKQEKGYYWHGYTIATLGENLQIDYYQFPSSGTDEWKRYSSAGVVVKDEKYGLLCSETIAPAGRPAPAVEISLITAADAPPAAAVAAVPGITTAKPSPSPTARLPRWRSSPAIAVDAQPVCSGERARGAYAGLLLLPDPEGRLVRGHR